MDLSHELLCKLADKYDLQWCDDYGERGYTTEKGVILGNWNNIPEHISKWLENKGFELEWDDEWYIDHNRSKCYRTTSDSWFWQPSVVWFDSSEPFTIDDIEEDPTEYLEQLENDPQKCDCFRVNLAEHGYELIDDTFEHGWHPGQTDDPIKY